MRAKWNLAIGKVGQPPSAALASRGRLAHTLPFSWSYLGADEAKRNIMSTDWQLGQAGSSRPSAPKTTECLSDPSGTLSWPKPNNIKMSVANRQRIVKS